MTLTTSEPPATPPVLRFVAPGRAAVDIALAVDAVDPNLFSGNVVVVEGSAAGNATFTLRVEDGVGNVGTGLGGASLAIDGVRPTASITTVPGSPVTLGTLDVNLSASEPVVGTPGLSFRDSAGAERAIVLAPNAALFSGQLVVDANTPEGQGSFLVSLVDVAGNTGSVVAAGGVLVIDASVPNAPINLIAAAAAQGRIALSWSAGVGGAARFRVWRSANAIVDVAGITPVAEITADRFTDTPPADGTFHYVVTALDAAGNESAPSNDAQARSDQTPPEAPSDLVAVVVNDAVSLSWSPPSGEPASSFELFRGSAPLPDVSTLTPVRSGLTATNVVDRPPSEGTFFYVVAAVDGAGLRGPGSNQVSIAFDSQAPRVTIEGVVDGTQARVAVTPVITIAEANLASSSATLDGQDFTSGTVVDVEGVHALSVEASDVGGRTTSRLVRFTLDFTAPVLTINGVTDGVRHTTAPAPTISATDTNLLLVSATLNGAPYASGTPIAVDDAYTLIATARDRAGNVTTQSVSFSVDLPPPPPALVAADLSDDGVALHWEPSSALDVTSYRVARNGTVIFLGDQLELDGGDLPVAPDAARFEVRAIDTFGQLSAPRTVTVNPLRIALIAVGTPDGAGSSQLTRGTFDELVLSIQNGDLVTHAVGPVSLAVDSAAGLELWSGDDPDVVSALATRGTDLPLVVFAPITADLFGNRVRVRVELGGGPSAPVAWQQSYDVDARFPPGRLIEPVHGALVRGTEAVISMKVTNRGSADLQVVTARGASPSPDLVVRLRDPAPGGFLLEVPVNDPLAGAVVGGLRVATLSPGATRTLKPVTLLIPADAPDNCILEVEARLVHSALGTGAAISEAGFVLAQDAGAGFYDERAVNVVPPPYLSTATPDRTEALPGEVVLLSGVATLTDTGSPADTEVVKLVVSQGGFDQTFFVRTDAGGVWTFPFFVGPESAGVFTVSATHPIVIVKELDASFIVHGLRLDPGVFNLSLSKNATFPVTFTLRNSGETDIDGIAVVVDDPNSSDGVTAVLREAAPVSLAPGRSVGLKVDVAAAVVAADSARFTIGVSTNQGLSRSATLDVAVFGATPSPLVEPRFLDVSLVAGNQLSRSVVVTNRGFGGWENVRVTAPTDVPFISVSTALEANLLVEPNGSFSFDVLFSPQSSAPSAVTNTTVLLESDNLPPIPLNITAIVTTDATGSVEFSVENLLHALDPADPDFAVVGASVRLQSQDVFTLTFQAFTDVDGKAVFSNIPAGRYTFVISASGFQTASSSTNRAETGEVIVDPARTSIVEAGLVESTVDIEWSVEPVSITDSYDITLTTTFQTTVPVPVVDTVPANQVFDMGPGAVRNGQFELVNVGLISAFDVRLTLRQDPNLDVQLAFARIAEIPAQSRVVVPFSVQLRSDASPPCTSYGATVDVAFDFFASGAGVFLPGVAFPASIDVRSHETDVRVEPNTIVRQTFVNCPGFAVGESVLPPAITLTNAEPVDLEICDCGRMTTAGADLPTLRTLAATARSGADDARIDLELVVETDLAFVGDLDLTVPPDAQTDADGTAFYGLSDWEGIKETGQRLGAAVVDADAALSAIDVAQPLLDQGLCEPRATGDDVTERLAALGNDLASPTLKTTLAARVGAAVRFDDVHTKFDAFCLAPGGGAIAPIPIEAGSFAAGTLSFATATGCGVDRVGSCCPVSVGFVEHRVVCSVGSVTTSQSGGGGGSAGGWGGWAGGGVTSGSNSAAQESQCTR
ncbi:MAG: carboxypeptidase regulatory-like domain-containing protein [Deltaproteobacteria bacterium]|nr:carboxypeptidase regulatory-like domain-containing protein [Deltaproteobacteria bacterium]